MRANKTISITEARKRIFDIAEEVQRPDVYYTLTEKGRPKIVIMSAEEFESLMETLEILGDPKIMESIKQAEDEYKRGEYVTLDQLKKELGYSSRDFVLADKGKKKYKVKKKK